ncbi:MAG TPA: ABC transporter permease [bacterium]|nr:ABC transporter permease [bacterium]
MDDLTKFAQDVLAELAVLGPTGETPAGWARLTTWVARRRPGALVKLRRIEANPIAHKASLIALLHELEFGTDAESRDLVHRELSSGEARSVPDHDATPSGTLAGPAQPRRALKTSPATKCGAALFVLVVLITVAGPLVYRVDPNELDYAAILTPPSSHHVLGTDALGRDLAARLLAGGRNSLLIGLLTMLATGVAGALLGLVSGANRRLDHYVMRFLDVMMAFPPLLLALAILASLGNSAMNVVIALSFVYVPRTARIVRGEALVLRDVVYVEAAQSLGASPLRIVFRHLLPGLLPPLVVQQTFLFAYAILGEAGLSFVGVGIQPPSASWGNILGEARAIFQQAPWLVALPGFAVALTVLSLNVLGDGLSDLFNPRRQTT